MIFRMAVVMANYRLSVQVIKRSSGRSAVAAAAYRSGERLQDERTAQAHDYTRKGGVLHSEIMAPDNAPDWMRDRGQLWNAVEAAEGRKDAQLAREIQLSLPHELDAETRKALVREFCQTNLVDHGMIADIALHSPSQQGDERNHHAHVMVTMRDLTGDGFGKKNRSWNDSERVEGWREDWARIQNRALERSGSRDRVDHRSLDAQGLDRQPTKHLGPIATEIERSGRASHRGDENRAIDRVNQARDAVRHAASETDRAIAFEKLKFENWAHRKGELLELSLSGNMQAADAKATAERAAFEKAFSQRHEAIQKSLVAQQEALEGRLSATGLRKVVRSLFGLHRRDMAALGAVQDQTVRIDQTKRAGIDEIERRQADQRAGIRSDYQRERDNLTGGVDRARMRREQSNWKAEKDRIQSAPRPHDKQGDEKAKPPTPPVYRDGQTRYETRADEARSGKDRRSMTEKRRDERARYNSAAQDKTPKKDSQARNPIDELAKQAQSRKAAQVRDEARKQVKPDTKQWAQQLKKDAQAFTDERKAKPDRGRNSGRVNFGINNAEPKQAKQRPGDDKARDRTPSATADIFNLGGVTKDVIEQFKGRGSSDPKQAIKRTREAMREADKRDQETQKRMRKRDYDRDR